MGRQFFYTKTLINPKIYTRQFWLVCASSLLFFGSFNMIIPKLPAFLTALGGGNLKGLIISAFTLTAMASRPFSGKLADTIGRIPVIMIGSIVCLVCSLIYPVLTSVSGFIFLRILHGFSTGFTPTGQAAFISDIIPANRRGEAMGLLGTAGALGMAGGPAIGGLVANAYGYSAMFYCSSAFAFVSLIILAGIQESRKETHRFRMHHLKVKRTDWFEPLVLVPCLVMVLCSFAYGTMFTLLPDLGYFMGIKNEGVLFMLLTAASLVVRLVGGKASDYWGRRPVLGISTIAIVVSMLIIAWADSRLVLMTGVILYGLAQGATSPTLLAWATDLSHEQFRGRGIASLYIFMEMGIGLGAFASGMLYGNDPSNFFKTFIVCSAFAAIAFLILMMRRTPRKLAL
jgi:MFS family permease